MKLWPFIFIFLITSCIPEDEIYFGEQEVEGYKPIYASTEEAQEIKILPAQPIEMAGKLYLYGNLLLINEIGKGIHMIDNIDPANPIKLGFLQVPGSHDMAIKNDIIYVNNYGDLLAVKITGGDQVEVTERLKDVIPSNSLYPIERGFYFECVDPGKGTVIGWQKIMLTNPKCYR